MFLTFKPFARLIARSGRKTLNTLRIFTTENWEDLKERNKQTWLTFKKYLELKTTYINIDIPKYNS